MAVVARQAGKKSRPQYDHAARKIAAWGKRCGGAPGAWDAFVKRVTENRATDQDRAWLCVYFAGTRFKMCHDCGNVMPASPARNGCMECGNQWWRIKTHRVGEV